MNDKQKKSSERVTMHHEGFRILLDRVEGKWSVTVTEFYQRAVLKQRTNIDDLPTALREAAFLIDQVCPPKQSGSGSHSG